MIDVTAAILIKDNSILIARRGPHDKLANKWELPGGKVEPGETPEECLAREIKEEFQIDVAIGDFFGESQYSYDHVSIRLLAYYAYWLGGEIKPTVHDEFRWVTVDELGNYDFAPADIPLIHRIVSLTHN